MLDDLADDERIKDEIDSLFEAAEREKYVHSRSKETFDAIAGFWFLGDVFQSVLARISRNYIVSSFLLNSLALIYQRIRSDYDLPEFDASTLTNDEALRKFMEEIERLKADDTFIQWLKDFLLPKCKELLEHVEARDLEYTARLGNLADSTEHIAKQYVSREDGDTWVYDSIFQFSDELLGISEKVMEAPAVIVPEDTGLSEDAGLSLDSLHSLPEILAGKSATNSGQELKSVA